MAAMAPPMTSSETTAEASPPDLPAKADRVPHQLVKPAPEAFSLPGYTGKSLAADRRPLQVLAEIR